MYLSAFLKLGHRTSKLPEFILDIIYDSVWSSYWASFILGIIGHRLLLNPGRPLESGTRR